MGRVGNATRPNGKTQEPMTRSSPGKLVKAGVYERERQIHAGLNVYCENYGFILYNEYTKIANNE